MNAFIAPAAVAVLFVLLGLAWRRKRPATSCHECTVSCPRKETGHDQPCP